MYEVEIKVELTQSERSDLVESFKEKGFLFEGVTTQYDYYVEAVESQYGGFDLKRYRDEDGKYIYTEKITELIQGEPTRKENEHEVSKEEFESKIKAFPDALKIKKDREWFSAMYKGVEISTIIDSVKFDHSPSMRYFIEAEIGVEDKNDVPKNKELIREFLKEILGKPHITEAWGMFSMAFKKL